MIPVTFYVEYEVGVNYILNQCTCVQFIQFFNPVQGNLSFTYWIAHSVQRLSFCLDDLEIGVRFPTGAGDFSSLRSVHIGSGAHPASYITDTGHCSRGEGDRVVKLTIHINLMPRLGMVELYLDSSYVFML